MDMRSREDEKPDRQGDRKSDDDADDTDPGPGAGNEHGDQAQHRRDRVQYGDGLLLAHPHVDQLVMDVTAVGMEGTLPVQDPAEESEDRVTQWDCE